MNRRGVALLAALWLTVVLSAVAGTAIAVSRTGLATSQNRLWLRRSEWAREACAQILVSQWYGSLAGLAVPETDLGNGVGCHATVSLVAARVNINRANPATLRRIVGSDSLLDALLDWQDSDDTPRRGGAEGIWYRAERRRAPRNGPLASIEELSLIRGFDRPSVARLRTLLTTDGDGTVDLNAAAPSVLAAMPGMSTGALAEIAHRRALGRRIQGLSDLADDLDPVAQRTLMASYQLLEQQTATASEELHAVVTGVIDGSQIQSTLELSLVPAGTRLAVIRRRAE